MQVQPTEQIVSLERYRLEKSDAEDAREAARLRLIARVLPDLPDGIAAIWIRPIHVFAVRPGLDDEALALAAELCAAEHPSHGVSVINDDKLQGVRRSLRKRGPRQP